MVPELELLELDELELLELDALEPELLELELELDELELELLELELDELELLELPLEEELELEALLEALLPPVVESPGGVVPLQPAASSTTNRVQLQRLSMGILGLRRSRQSTSAAARRRGPSSAIDLRAS